MTVVFPVRDTVASIELIHIVHTVKENVVELKDVEDRYYFRTTSMKESHYYTKSSLIGPPVIVS